MQYVTNAYNFFYQLNALLQNNISIVHALSIISHMQGKSEKTKRISNFVLEQIQKGYTFSRSVSMCPYLLVDTGTIQLLEASEYASCVKSVLDFICVQEERRRKALSDTKNACAYPLFVIVLALVGTFFLMYYKDLYLTTITSSEIIFVVAKAISILCLLLILLGIYVGNTVKEPPLFKLYYSIGFLQDAGFTFAQAVELCLQNVFPVQIYKGLKSAYSEISKGMKISSSFQKVKLANEELSVLLEIAENTQTVGKTCLHIAKTMMHVHEQKKKQCFQIMEPVLLLIVGLYVLILVNGILLPYITDFGGLL